MNKLFFIFLVSVVYSFAHAEVTQGDSAVSRIYGSNSSSGVFEPFEIDEDVKGIVTSLATYEAVTADENGTLLPAINNNRNSTNTALTKIRLDPTNVVTTEAAILRASIIGTAGGTSQRSGGTIERLSECILKKNTKYLIRIVNLGNSTNNLNYACSWYEVQD